MPLTVDEAKAVVIDFCRAYPVAATVPYFIRNTQQEAFDNDKLTPEKVGTLFGAYLPGRRGTDIPGRESGPLVALSASAHDSPEALWSTLRHELLGHFGLNTLSPREKRAVLGAIASARDRPDVAPIWQEVERNYPDIADPLRKAEEVYCRVCEQIEPHRRHDTIAGANALQRVALEPDAPLTVTDIGAIASHVADGLRDRTRRLQIIPETDRDQFRQDAPPSTATAQSRDPIQPVQPSDRPTRRGVGSRELSAQGAARHTSTRSTPVSLGELDAIRALSSPRQPTAAAKALAPIERLHDINRGFDCALASVSTEIRQLSADTPHIARPEQRHRADLKRTAATAALIRAAARDEDLVAPPNRDATRAAIDHALRLGVQLRHFAEASALLNSAEGNRTTQTRADAEFAALRSASLLGDVVPAGFGTIQTRDFARYRALARGMNLAREMISPGERAVIDKDPVAAFEQLTEQRARAAPAALDRNDVLRVAALGAAVRQDRQHDLTQRQYFEARVQVLAKSLQIDQQRTPGTAQQLTTDRSLDIER
jgi:hypothetical protein